MKRVEQINVHIVVFLGIVALDVEPKVTSHQLLVEQRSSWTQESVHPSIMAHVVRLASRLRIGVHSIVVHLSTVEARLWRLQVVGVLVSRPPAQDERLQKLGFFPILALKFLPFHH